MQITEPHCTLLGALGAGPKNPRLEKHPEIVTPSKCATTAVCAETGDVPLDQVSIAHSNTSVLRYAMPLTMAAPGRERLLIITSAVAHYHPTDVGARMHQSTEAHPLSLLMPGTVHTTPATLIPR